MSNYAKKHGVTLVEMVIVIAVIVLLASMVIGIAMRIDNQNKERALSHTFSLLDTALYEYREFKGNFPVIFGSEPADRSEKLYAELFLKPGSRQILSKMSNSLLKNKFTASVPGPNTPEIYDPWGTVLDYNCPDTDSLPKIISAGPDKVHGNGDDITNR